MDFLPFRSTDVDSDNVLEVTGMQKFIIVGFLIKIENKQVKLDRHLACSKFQKTMIAVNYNHNIQLRSKQ